MPVFKGAASGAAFDNEQLAHLRSVFEAACADLGIAVNEPERSEHVALLIMEMARDGEFDGEALRRRAVERAYEARS